MLYRPQELDPQEEAILERIIHFKKELDFALTPSRWFGSLRRDTFARAVQGSNSIEGYVVPLDDAVAAVAGHEPLDAKAETWSVTQGYRNAMTLVMQKEDDPYFTYSHEFFNALHFMMVGHDLTKHPGRWRPGVVYVRDEAKQEIVYEAPSIEQVPALMAELVASLNAPRDNSIITAAMAHLNYVLVHPHSDGNGRVARCLQSLVLARTMGKNPIFVSIEEYLGSNTDEYYSVLAKVGGGSWQPKNDTRPWIRFCLRAHYRQAMTVKRRAERWSQLYDLIEQAGKTAGIPERSYVALTETAVGYRLRNNTYRSNAEVSELVATKDLKNLVDAGFLVPHGEKRGRYYSAGPRLDAIVQQVERPLRPGDPFEEVGGIDPTRLNQ